MEVLVYGWYWHENIGDQLFIDAYKILFPNISFTFVSNITSSMLNGKDAIFIGGGSMLDGAPDITTDALEDMKSIPIFYVGIGSETNIHPIHKDLMSIAKLIALRSDDKLQLIKLINHNTILIPDLVYAITTISQHKPINKSVLILPNISVLPTNNDPHYKHAAWEYFKTEFSQFLDHMVEGNYKLSFLSMCNNNQLNDNFASVELVSRMKYRDYGYIKPLDNVVEELSKYSLVITQRYHGIVLAELAGVPYIAIHHHNKLKSSYNNAGVFVPYYGFNKQKMWDEMHSIDRDKSHVAITQYMFEELKHRINSLL